MKKAFIIASTGRPGPVVVDVPKDVTAHLAEFEYPATLEMRSYNPVAKGHSGQMKRAVQMLLEAKRPMIYTGGGVVLGDASEQLAEFTRLLGFPITNTLMGLGGYPATDRQNLGMPGMHGTYEANMAMQHCDVLLAVGARFDDRVIGNPAHFAREQRRIIHIDIDPSSISKRVRVDVPIVGDVQNVLADLLVLLKQPRKNHAAALKAWWTQIELWRSKTVSVQRNGSIINRNIVEKCGSDQGRCLHHFDVCHHQCGRRNITIRQAASLDQFRRLAQGVGLPTHGLQLAFPERRSPASPANRASTEHPELSTCKQYRSRSRSSCSTTATWACCAVAESSTQPLPESYMECCRFRQAGRIQLNVGMPITNPRRRGRAEGGLPARAEDRNGCSWTSRPTNRERLPMVEGARACPK